MSTRTSRVVWDLIARDNASRTFARVSGAATGLNRTGAGVGAALKRSFALGSVAVAGLGYSVLKASGDFEKSMNQVRAVSGATGKDFTDLRDQAKKLGRETKFSASQAADGMGFLAMAGFKAKDILAAMPGVLSLASAGNMDLARSSDIASNVLTGYGFKAKDTQRIVDVLAKTFTSTNTNLEQLGEAMKYAAPVAHSAGVKFEEASAAIGLMGNAGIQASMAGTSLRGSISRLLAPTKQIQQALDKLGVKVRDSQGNLLPLADIIDQLGKKGAKTGDLMTIFGQRAGPAMAALIDQGAPALRHLTKDLEHAGGTADRIAKIQMEGLQGQLVSLKSAWEGLMIEIGDLGVLHLATGAVEGLTSATRGFTGFIDKYAKPAAKGFTSQLSNLVPLDSIKTKFDQAKGIVGDFLTGLGLGGGGKAAPKSPLDKFPTTVLQRLGGAPHLGSGQSSSTSGPGQPLAQAPHFGVGQVAPTTGVQGAPLAPQPHGGSGQVAPLVKPAAAAPKSAAQQLGETIRKAVTDGINGIDANKVGSMLGGALGKAFDWVTKNAGQLAGKLIDALAGMDWVDVGKKVGGHALGFAIGFVSSLGSELFSADFWKKHWWDTIIAVLSVFGIGKIAGPLSKILSKIPILKIFAPLVEKLGGLTKPLSDGISKYIVKPLGRFGKAILDGIASGFTKVFPSAAGKLELFVGRLALTIIGYAGRLVGVGERLIGGLGGGILKAGGQIGKWIGEITGYILRPFVRIGSWLWSRGAELVSGLKRGAVNAARALGAWAWRTMGRPAVDAFRTVGTWLWSKGVSFVSGLKSGVVNGARAIGTWAWMKIGRPAVDAFRTVGTWLWSKGVSFVSGLKSGISNVARTITTWVGRHVALPAVNAFRYASGWLVDKGRAFISGLKNGIVGAVKGIGSWIKSNLIDPIVGAVKHFFGIHSPSTVFAEIGGHLVAGLFKGLAATSGTAIVKKIFGDMPTALSSIVGKGLVAVKGLPKKAIDALGGIGGAITGVSPGASGAMALGQQMALNNYGWSGDQWNALKQLWMGESGWNYRATNPSSGAYGIPQALPASKMASAGPDWRTNPGTQILWGLRYIKSVYGSPANAYRKWLSRSPHWYDEGGVATGKGFMAKNTLQPERVLSPQQTRSFDRLVDLLASGGLGAGGGGHFEGQLVLDSGELMGVIKGTVKPMIRASEQEQARRAKVGRRS